MLLFASPFSFFFVTIEGSIFTRKKARTMSKLLLRRVISVLGTMPRLQGRWFSDQDLLDCVRIDKEFDTTTLKDVNRVIQKDRCFVNNHSPVYDAEGRSIVFHLWYNRNKCNIEGGTQRNAHCYRTSKNYSNIVIPHSITAWTIIYN